MQQASAQREQLESGVRRIVVENADEIAQRFPKVWRTVSGYALNRLDLDNLNLARLFAGSEGTLGTAVEIELALVDRPVNTRLVILHYDDMRAMFEMVPAILEVGPSAVEMVDKPLLDLTRAHPDYSRLLTFIEGDPAALLMVEFYGESDAELSAKVDRLKAHVSRAGLPGRDGHRGDGAAES